jgi:26S proteasome regulatory subunit N7
MEAEFDFDAELKKLDEKIKHAEENFGDIEIRDAVIDKAEFCLKHKRTELAIEIY